MIAILPCHVTLLRYPATDWTPLVYPSIQFAAAATQPPQTPRRDFAASMQESANVDYYRRARLAYTRSRISFGRTGLHGGGCGQGTAPHHGRPEAASDAGPLSE